MLLISRARSSISKVESASAVRANQQRRQIAFNTNEAGFTLLELLVALGIIALVAAIAYPQVTRYLGSARTETARAQMSALSTALELYALDNGGYPTQQVGLSALVTRPSGANRWNGPYLKGAQGLIDPWGQPYRYIRTGNGSTFELSTMGRDKASGGTGEDQDLVKN